MMITIINTIIKTITIVIYYDFHHADDDHDGDEDHDGDDQAKMHQLSVDGAAGGPGVVDYRKDNLIITIMIIMMIIIMIIMMMMIIIMIMIMIIITMIIITILLLSTMLTCW